MPNLQQLNFDARQVEPTSFDVLPPGNYEVVIAASELKRTASGRGQYLKLELQVISGPYQNRKLFDNLNILNPNEQAQQIARGTLSAICRAVDVLTPKDSSELHLKPMLATVAIKPAQGEYQANNIIKAYKPRQAGPAPLPPAQPQPAAPQPAGPITPDEAPWG